jgi:hypothetical protein
VNVAVTVKVVFSPVFRAIFNHPELDVVLPKTDASIRGFTGNALNQQPVPLKDQDIVSLLYYISGG